ncbi:hypothetical protein Tco_0754954 [Tanacetum coccineum]
MLHMKEEGTYKAELSFKTITLRHNWTKGRFSCGRNGQGQLEQNLARGEQPALLKECLKKQIRKMTNGKKKKKIKYSEIQNGYLEKYFQEFITSTTNEGRDSADTNLIKKEVVRPLKSSKGKGLDSDEGNSKCIMFMKLANNNKVVLKHREISRECFESMLKWFHNTYIEGDVTKLMPPTIGGYERLNYKMKWDEVSLGFGFSGLYGLRFKEIYVHYLLIPKTYFEVAKVGLTSTDDYIRENYLVTGNNEVSMMSEQVNKVDIEGTGYKSRLGTNNEHQAGKGRLELHLIKTSEEDLIAVYNIRG